MIALGEACKGRKKGENERLLVSTFLEKAELERQTVWMGGGEREIVSTVAE